MEDLIVGAGIELRVIPGPCGLPAKPGFVLENVRAESGRGLSGLENPASELWSVGMDNAGGWRAGWWGEGVDQ